MEGTLNGPHLTEAYQIKFKARLVGPVRQLKRQILAQPTMTTVGTVQQLLKPLKLNW